MFNLLDMPGALGDGSFGQGHGLNLVAGHIDHGGTEFTAEAGYLKAHLHTQLGVQVGQGLVRRKNLGISCD